MATPDLKLRLPQGQRGCTESPREQVQKKRKTNKQTNKNRDLEDSGDAPSQSSVTKMESRERGWMQGWLGRQLERVCESQGRQGGLGKEEEGKPGHTRGQSPELS